MPEAMTASIKRRCEWQKRKSVPSFFRQRNARRLPDAPQQTCLISTGGIRVEKRLRGSRYRAYRRPSATPKSTGCSAVALQRQLPPSVFWNAKAFSILSRCATPKLSLLASDGLALPDFKSQQVPVQLDAIGLQTANGESTTISTSAVTSALCSATSLSISNTRLGQSSDVAVLALISAPSTADVTALMWLTDAFGSLWSNALPQETARLNPTAGVRQASRASFDPF
jgi:hypothetical protein